MPSHQFEFTEMEKFTITNTPQIVDALASTYNRIAELFRPLSDDVEDLLKKSVAAKGYIVDTRKARAFTPFGFAPGTQKHDRLSRFMQYRGGFDFSRKAKKGRTAGSFGVDFGYYYDPTVHERGYFYFGVYNWRPKQYGEIPSRSFFEQVRKSLPADYEVDVYKEGSGLEIVEWKADASQILEIIDRFKDNVVVPFLGELP